MRLRLSKRDSENKKREADREGKKTGERKMGREGREKRIEIGKEEE